MKVIALISGGKDSTFNMMECTKRDHEIGKKNHRILFYSERLRLTIFLISLKNKKLLSSIFDLRNLSVLTTI